MDTGSGKRDLHLAALAPDERGRGFATSLVAAQSRWLLEQGRQFCFLYTDLANPTSNRIYARIGYEPVCDSTEITFTA